MRTITFCPGGAALRGSAGRGTVTGNLTGALAGLFTSAAVAIVAMITFRDDPRARRAAPAVKPGPSPAGAATQESRRAAP